MIDRSLNYGRHLVRRQLQGALPWNSVLDIGAGRGADLRIAKDVNPAAKLHALDCDAEKARFVRDSGIDTHVLDIEKQSWPLADGSMDVIIANQILEHTKELFWVFHEMTRVLAVGGHLIVGIPNLASLHNRVLLAIGRQPTAIHSDSAHIRGFTLPALLDFNRQCFPGGYRLCDWGGSNFYPFPPVMAGLLATLLPSMAVTLVLLFEKTKTYGREYLEYPKTQMLETNFFLGTNLK